MASTSEDTRDYDFIVFGVTGYTGKYVAEELYRIQEEGKLSFTWAAAGRNETKVKETLSGNGHFVSNGDSNPFTDLGIEGVATMMADVYNEESIERMCGRASVILDVVGPYVLFGEVVMKACINQRCDYVDITGETFVSLDHVS